jgi:hypothetical protein
MKPNLTAGFNKEASPEPTLPAYELGPDFIANKPSLQEAPVKLIVRFPRERELPVPIALVRLSHAARLNSFRSFGINE